tara:strand:- start:60715 stop:61002 length:288 start_codon:yes stop_codon:yes gene_type:complete
MSYNEEENPDLLKVVEKENELKSWLVEYVGNKVKPDNNEVNIEMIIGVVAEDFPDFLLPVAEENFIRGYRQALQDVEDGEKYMKEQNEKLHNQKQ